MKARTIIASTIAVVFMNIAPAAAAPAHDDFASATPINVLPYQDTFDASGATIESGEAEECAPMTGSVWYRWQASTSVPLIADTRGSDVATVLTLFRGSSPFDLTVVDCASFTSISTIEFTPTSGDSYYFQVGLRSTTGTGAFNLGMPAALSGEVLDAISLDPLSDICVDIFDATYEHIQLGSTLTDLDGEYSIGGLPQSDVRAKFKDCADQGPDAENKQRLYRKQWYSGAKTFDTATPIGLVGGLTTSNVDVRLTMRARPDVTVTDLRVEDVPVSIGPSQDAGFATGTTRDVHVDVSNVGEVSPRWTRVTVEVCPRTMGSCGSLGSRTVTLPPGAAVTLTYRWASPNMVGDVIITAMADLNEDVDWTNNVAEIDAFLHIGGTGIGVGI